MQITLTSRGRIALIIMILMLQSLNGFARTPGRSTNVPIDDVIAYFDKKARAGSETDEFKTVADLLKMGRDKLEIKSLNLTQQEATRKEFINVSRILIQDEFRTAILKHGSWTNVFSNSERERLLSRLDRYKGYLSENPYVWSWVLFQAGKVLESRQTLEIKFNDLYSHFMKTSGHYASGWETPMKQEESFYQALISIVPAKDRKGIDKKMSDMNEHLKKLDTSPSAGMFH